MTSPGQRMMPASARVLAVRIAGVAATMGLNVVVTRTLGAAGAGVFFVAVSVIVIGSVLVRGGLDNTVLKATSMGEAGDGTVDIRGVRTDAAVVVRTSMLGTLAVGLLGAGLAVAVSSVLPVDAVVRPVRNALPWIVATVGPAGALLLLGEALKGRGLAAWGVSLKGVLVPGVAAVVVLLLAPRLGDTGALIGYAGAHVAVLAVAWWVFARNAPGHAGARFRWRTLTALWVVSGPLFVYALCTAWLGYSDTLLLSLFVDQAHVGVYGASARLALLLAFPLAAVNAVFAPAIARHLRTGDLPTLERASQRAAGLAALAALPLAALYAVAGGRILALLFGEGFAAGWLALLILAAAQLFNAASGPVGYLLVMAGHNARLRTSALWAVATNLSLNLALIPWLGMAGAAIGTGMSIVVLNGLNLYFAGRDLGIRPIPLAIRRSPGAEQQP